MEGMSLCATARVAGASTNTVSKLLVECGRASVRLGRIECDEIWAFNYAREKNVPRAKAAPPDAGDVWTWTALDPDTKLILSWHVGGRDMCSAYTFAADLRRRVEGTSPPSPLWLAQPSHSEGSPDSK